jgi:hypothetical protein
MPNPNPQILSSTSPTPTLAYAQPPNRHSEKLFLLARILSGIKIAIVGDIDRRHAIGKEGLGCQGNLTSRRSNR